MAGGSPLEEFNIFGAKVPRYKVSSGEVGWDVWVSRNSNSQSDNVRNPFLMQLNQCDRSLVSPCSLMSVSLVQSLSTTLLSQRHQCLTLQKRKKTMFNATLLMLKSSRTNLNSYVHLTLVLPLCNHISPDIRLWRIHESRMIRKNFYYLGVNMFKNM